MTQFENPLRLVRELKGVTLTVFITLYLLGEPAGEQRLSSLTGYSERSVRNALRYLEMIDVARRNRRYEGWTLTNGARQLPLAAPLEKEEENPPLPPLVKGGMVRGAVNSSAPGEEVEKRLERAVNSSTPDPRQDAEAVEPVDKPVDNPAPTLKRAVNSSAPGEEVEERLERAVNSSAPVHLASSSRSLIRSRSPDKELPLARSVDPASLDQIAEILDKAGIRNPARARILGMADIDPGWVRGHLETAENTGLAIYRIEHRFGLPKSYRPDAPKSWAEAFICPKCHCRPCQCDEEEEDV